MASNFCALSLKLKYRASIKYDAISVKSITAGPENSGSDFQSGREPQGGWAADLESLNYPRESEKTAKGCKNGGTPLILVKCFLVLSFFLNYYW